MLKQVRQFYIEKVLTVSVKEDFGILEEYGCIHWHPIVDSINLPSPQLISAVLMPYDERQEANDPGLRDLLLMMKACGSSHIWSVLDALEFVLTSYFPFVFDLHVAVDSSQWQLTSWDEYQSLELSWISLEFEGYANTLNVVKVVNNSLICSCIACF